jgi:hypothetical protein
MRVACLGDSDLTDKVCPQAVAETCAGGSLRSIASELGAGHSAQLRGVVRKGLLRPTGIAWIASVVAWVAITATAIDKQCAVYSRCGKAALERPHIVSQVVAVKAWVAEHDDSSGWRRFLI